MTNNCSGLTSLHRCANDGINPPSVVHKPQEIRFNFVQEGINAAFRAGTPIEGWVGSGRIKFRFQPSGEVRMIAYDLGQGEVAFSERQQENLLFDAEAAQRIGKGVR
jgi:hypothetical protein